MFGIYLYSYPGAFEKDLSQTGSSILKWFNGESARAPSAQVPAAARTAGDAARTVSQEVPAASTESLPPSAQALSADFQTRSAAIAPDVSGAFVNYSVLCEQKIEACMNQLRNTYGITINIKQKTYFNDGVEFIALVNLPISIGGITSRELPVNCSQGILSFPGGSPEAQSLNNQFNC